MMKSLALVLLALTLATCAREPRLSDDQMLAASKIMTERMGK